MDPSLYPDLHQKQWGLLIRYPSFMEIYSIVFLCSPAAKPTNQSINK